MTNLRSVSKWAILASAATIIACGGGGGTTVTGNRFAGNYTGTFVFRTHDPDGGISDPNDGTATAVIASDGTINVKLTFSDGYDRLLGTVNSEGSASGAYYYNIQDNIEPPDASRIHAHKATFSKAGSDLIITFNGYPNNAPTTIGWSGTVTLRK
jgi:hypothetical protein